MRIGISAFYRMQGGSLTHLRHILEVWTRDGIDREHEIVIFARDTTIEQLRGHLTPNMKVVPVGSNFGPIKKVLWEQFRFGSVLRREKIDVLFCTGNLIPLFTRTPTVLALRNAGPFCESMTIRNVGWSLWLYMKLLGILMRVCSHRATRVIFISQFFRNIFAGKGFDLSKGDVIYHGRDASELAAERIPALPHAPERAMLFVGNLYRYKNVAELIEAYAVDRDFFVAQNIKLIVVGKPIDAPYDAHLKALIARHGLAEHVLMTGHVSHEEIHAWMKRCELFIFQSTCENCPNTLIEALAAGLPIASSNAGVMPEIAGDGAAYFDPFDPKDIARALRAVLSNPALAAELREKARAQSLKFPTWLEVGRMTFDTLRHAAAITT